MTQSASAGTDTKREMLRHTVATLAYRASKCLRDVPEGFAHYQASPGTRTPVQILAHMGDLFQWAVSLAQGRHEWSNAEPLAWQPEADRFFQLLESFDACLGSSAPLGSTPEQLFQGPVSDALSHLGQIALLRRMAGGPVKGENYYKARIQAGHAGWEQAPPVFEFD